ncbi:MAG: hypothetical protein CMO34_03765 [Verrucomicrobia bacterium]|nr:hypothetical protein [Verrucomicrobiota bacterium]
MRKKYYTILLLLFLALSACKNYLGDETDLSFIEVPEQNFREVAYVPVQPILNQFNRPTDIIAGFDELIYVVDSATQEIIALDESGKELGRKFVQGARAIAQDRRFNLLVIGTYSDPASGVLRSSIYRLNLNTAFGYGIQFAQITDSIIHPFYFKPTAITDDLDVQLNRITVLGDNSYYVTRSGPRSNSFGGPDNAVLLFDENDKYITPIVVSDNRGAQFSDFFQLPFAISSLTKPPQISADERGDFVFTSFDPNGILKVNYIQRLESVDGISYIPKIDWDNDRSKADRFINDAFRFNVPSGIEITGDGTNYIFVVDRKRDSLYQFTFTGLEGVQPPPGSGETKFISTSFGGKGVGPTQFNNPMGVAYAGRILYVADTDNGRVLRFKLTLDIR